MAAGKHVTACHGRTCDSTQREDNWKQTAGVTCDRTGCVELWQRTADRRGTMWQHSVGDSTPRGNRWQHAAGRRVTPYCGRTFESRPHVTAHRTWTYDSEPWTARVTCGNTPRGGKHAAGKHVTTRRGRYDSTPLCHHK